MMIELIKPENNAIINLKTPIQKEFEKDIENNANTPRWAERENSVLGFCSRPAPIRFEWEADGDAEFLLSDTETFEKILRRAKVSEKYEVYNLELGKKYYWRVGNSEIRSFTTELSPPRWIFAEGVHNVRDIGGYTTVDGKRIRQGMIFRGSEFDTVSEGKLLTENGAAVLCDHLGLRLDFDLRDQSETSFTSSPVGDKIKYERISSESYAEFVDWKSNTQKMLKLLADKDNYPMYIHCAIGSDRTGSLIGIILGLLGLSEKNMTEEYEQSTLSICNSNRTRHEWTWPAYMNKLKSYGDNFTDRIYNYVISCGITAEEIETIRSIMLEE